jgi:hypothetical protein
MIQQLLSVLPQQVHPIALIIAVSGSVLGGILWLGGSRFSRTVVTLLCVSTGGLVGLQLPWWFGWALEGWATAVLGALVLGIAGYALHRIWVGFGLGLVLAFWAALAAFALSAPRGGFTWPVTPAGSSLTTQALDLWVSLPADTRELLPFACAAAMLMGITASVVWPRLGVVLLYSTSGISLLVGMGTLVLNTAKREWLTLIPSHTSSQLIVLVSAVAFGAVLQWRCPPTHHTTTPRRTV